MLHECTERALTQFDSAKCTYRFISLLIRSGSGSSEDHVVYVCVCACVCVCTGVSVECAHTARIPAHTQSITDRPTDPPTQPSDRQMWFHSSRRTHATCARTVCYIEAHSIGRACVRPSSSHSHSSPKHNTYAHTARQPPAATSTV